MFVRIPSSRVRFFGALTLVAGMAGMATLCLPALASDVVVHPGGMRPPTPPVLIVDYCASESPDATLAFGAKVPSVESVSPGATYASSSTTHPKCLRWLTDVSISAASAVPPSQYAAGIQLTVSGGVGPYPFVLTQTDCATYLDRATIYVKHAGETNFTTVTELTAKGTWVNGHCSAGAAANVTPPATGTDVYRIAATHEVLGGYKSVRGSAYHPPQP